VNELRIHFMSLLRTTDPLSTQITQIRKNLKPETRNR